MVGWRERGNTRGGAAGEPQVGFTNRREVGGVWGVESEKGEEAILLGDFWPILIFRLPFGSFVCGHGPSRADTEVRPPATL